MFELSEPLEEVDRSWIRDGVAWYDVFAADRLFHSSLDLLAVDGSRDFWHCYQKFGNVARR